MKFSMKNFLSKCDQTRRKPKSADLVPFTEEILYRKLHFLGSVCLTILWTLDFIDWKTLLTFIVKTFSETILRTYEKHEWFYKNFLESRMFSW